MNTTTVKLELCHLPYRKSRGKLEAQRVIKFLHWAAPIIPITKQDDTIRICGDYKLTVNKLAKTDVYPLPNIDELLLH